MEFTMYKKRILIPLAIIVVLVATIAIPASHVLNSYIDDTAKTSESSSRKYINDASGLNRTKVDTIISVKNRPQEIRKQLRDIIRRANADNKKISIAGARHSMGGHVISPDGIVIDMRPYRWMMLDTTTDILKVGSGAMWTDILNYLDGHDRSVGVMQAFANFSVGGSISVNGHGWQHNRA
ncbi:MAG TPA: FAD-dependent oxidoreductase, partial [Patescibacteria group bacterium]|nr:FAD-dependent oxidoreductase [Patescibacteria group bacterium]